MSIIDDEPGPDLARRIRLEREARGWSLADLAERSGVSKAMISKVERAEASPTAALLGRLSGAFGLTLSTLLARAEGGGGRVVRAAEQPLWTDPATGYVRRQVSPASDIPLELTQVELPAGAEVAFPAASYAFIRQMVWVLDGELVFVEGGTVHELSAGDCIALGSPADCVFRNASGGTCRYLVAVLRQG
ncbi:MAG TPA: XRE family transcriptional regulator [Azospirillaceae bacterium]|nr:XRE family transcriptional regulator [Azospirillaceae bacterium]